MKSISVTFTDEEHTALLKAKGELSWHDFILKMLEERGEGGKVNTF